MPTTAARAAAKKAATKRPGGRRPGITRTRWRPSDPRRSSDETLAVLRDAVTTIDLNRLRTIGSDLSEGLTSFAEFLDLSDQESTPTWYDPTAFVVTRNAFLELARTLREYELDEGLSEFAYSLPVATWPSPWERLFLPAVAMRTLEAASNADWVGFGTPEMSKWTPSRIESVWKSLQGSVGDDSSNPGRGRRFRWVGAWVKVASGGLAAAVDIAGAAVATVTAGPVGFVAAAAPTAASIIAGGKAVSKGLSELGDIDDEVRLA